MWTFGQDAGFAKTESSSFGLISIDAIEPSIKASPSKVVTIACGTLTPFTAFTSS